VEQNITQGVEGTVTIEMFEHPAAHELSRLERIVEYLKVLYR
jgi:predicted RNase H-like nuclease